MSLQTVEGTIGRNTICIIISCYRLVGMNENLIGYSGRIKNKIRH